MEIDLARWVVAASAQRHGQKPARRAGGGGHFSEGLQPPRASGRATLASHQAVLWTGLCVTWEAGAAVVPILQMRKRRPVLRYHLFSGRAPPHSSPSARNPAPHSGSSPGDVAAALHPLEICGSPNYAFLGLLTLYPHSPSGFPCLSHPDSHPQTLLLGVISICCQHIPAQDLRGLPRPPQVFIGLSTFWSLETERMQPPGYRSRASFRVPVSHSPLATLS